MRILNEALRDDLREGRGIRLELGGGDRRARGFYSVDIVELEGVDVIADLNEPLSEIPDNSVDHLYSCHVFEHIQKLDVVMREAQRITRPGGKIELVVPHFSNPYHYSDPTHVRTFGLYSMHYYMDRNKQPGHRRVPAFYNDIRFEHVSVRIEFYRSSLMDYLVAPWLEPLVNLHPRLQDWYERRVCSLYHAWQLRFFLRPDKR